MAIHRQPAPLLPRIGRARFFIFHHFNRQDHASLAYLRYMRMFGERRRRVRHVRRQLPVAVDHVVITKDIERGVGGGAGQRVAGVGMRMQEGLAGSCIRRKRPA